ncbi:protein of unknown function DUF1549 [Fibrella aestuarina BUZ 2]|uniref:Cytochrome c domain-containing protein n=1 Tax=Fibrella aestuarina BUZ 2 TaxID=1166018 RepID=I0KH16_9BACT|nr:DUF1553 domain-containing protein [Fibrella aestuarina]CCH03419.1 protein of unknown function DUF1549 [Fibrella aestuarina BUZ 2]
MKAKWLAIGGGVAVIALSSFSVLGLFSEPVDFNTQIKPILNKNCIACHGGVKKASDFSLLFKEEALAPAKSGHPAIIPGDADGSELIRRLSLTDPDERMPLDAPPLKPEEIELLRKWVDQGAEWGDHWAYQTPDNPNVPSIGTVWSRLGLSQHPETDWATNEIDQFVLEKLREKGLTVSPMADKATLLRRVSLDLTGLPPTEAEVKTFMANSSPQAYENAVDRLLASPAFGEKWAGMWLDLARYADTKGYERDPGRTIWRYRDYLIRAFNSDKPYDQFLTEQLAGDLLPAATDEQLIATGFHRNTMNNDEGGTQDEEFRVAALLDRVSTTWDVFQGTTFACVQCHSHPYDPFRHEEYYKYMAFFNNARDEDVTSETPTLRFYKGADSIQLNQLTTYLKRSIRDPQKANAEVRRVQLMARTMEPKINSHAFDQYVNASLLDAKYFGVQHQGSARIPNVTLTGLPRLYIAWGTNADDAQLTFRLDSPTGRVLATAPVPKTGSSWSDSIQVVPLPPVSGKHHIYLSLSSPTKPKEWTMIKWVSFQSTMAAPAETLLLSLLNKNPEQTPIMLDGQGDLARTTHVFTRGSWLTPGKAVQPDVPHALPPMDTDEQTLPRNRLGLARWMTRPDHPLTARVAVNRFWEQLFGAGIVETVEDMGTQGSQPTHRELLDWLAVTFIEDDHWSMKQLLKRMVLSSTYRQQANATPQQLAVDPFNRYYARGPRVRLAAEQVRDQALAVSGLLSRKMYGPSVMPPQPDGIWQSPYNGESWVQAQGDDKYRRALYTYWKRTSPYPSMITFDSPSREFCQIRRLRTNTPLQALVTLNDPVYVEAAQRLADYMTKHGTTPDAQIQAGFRRIMLRDLAPKKLAVLTRLYTTTEAWYTQHPAEANKLLATASALPKQAALTVTANAMMNLDEVITKE